MMNTTDVKLVPVVTWVALAVAFLLVVAIPSLYWQQSYGELRNDLDLRAKIKASALVDMVSSEPAAWMFSEQHLQGVLARFPLAVESGDAAVFDLQENLLAHVGTVPNWPLMRRSAPLFDSARVVGRVEVGDSLIDALGGTLLAALLGLLVGSFAFFAVRTFQLRALRDVTAALHQQKDRAEVTLRSIGDGVVTTDAHECVEFLNPTAEKLSGWTLEEAQGRPLAQVLCLVDAATGTQVSSPMHQALTENHVVVFRRDINLIRRDGSILGIDDSASPIHDASGRVSGGVMVFRDVSAARDLTRQRSWEATHDVLTGLVKRREFDRLVEISVITARNVGKQHVACYLDLDQFKLVNDTCGHAAGDMLLKEVAVLLQSHIREADTLAHLGGDEFGLLLDGCSIERAQIIAANLLSAVGDYRFNFDSKVFSVGVSIGLSIVTGESCSAEVLSTADTACYWAKEQGRNRVCVYRATDSDMASRRRETGWIAGINLALAQNRFVLYHQTYLPLGGEGSGADATEHLEVLIRLIDEDGKLIQPGSFLPAAERYNLMPTIDRWVVSTVMAGYHTLVAERGGKPLTCAINLSGTSINSEGFLDFVRAQAAKHMLPKRAICFEVTETAAVNNLRKAAEFILECKHLGFLFALDDFGTGTSSFGYLKNLPVDYLKIDGGFVKNLEHDAVDKAMTETINRIGHIMGIKTIAEYAENEAIIEELRAMGVDYAQGYGVCRPSPLFDASNQLTLQGPLPA